MDEAVKDGGGNGSVAKEVSPPVKALVGGNNKGGSLTHGGNETKEQIGLGGQEGIKPTSSTTTRAALWRYLR